MNNCMNCKFSEVLSTRYMICINSKVQYGQVAKDFGCKKWELRELNHEKEEME